MNNIENILTLSDCVQQVLADLPAGRQRPLLVGLSGPQGSGKTTVVREVLDAVNLRVVSLCLDDFYLTKLERQALAREVSPLFVTRGPPGTHDMNLVSSTIDHLIDAAPDTAVLLPQFDKASDDRLHVDAWRSISGERPDVVLMEGWMMGATLAEDFVDGPPLNGVEAEDKDGAWRSYQAEQLSGNYEKLWDQFDAFVHIEGPGMDAVRQWRLQQEGSNLGQAGQRLSDDRRAWVLRFVQHFERLTLDMAKGNRRSGSVIEIDVSRNFVAFQTEKRSG